MSTLEETLRRIAAENKAARVEFAGQSSLLSKIILQGGDLDGFFGRLERGSDEALPEPGEDSKSN